ncbi:MAG: MFS transporter [Candidatus Protochlamydia sp.]|nr:MFS transporter [Candidatus Protochlamydia sp.]
MAEQRKQFWVILIIVFLGFLGISMPYLIFPSLFLNPAYSILDASWNESSRALLLGVTLAAYPLGQFIGSPILGSLSDDYGRKSLLWGSLLVSAVCYLLSGFAIAWHSLELLILGRFLAGLMEGNIAIARAMASDLKLISKPEAFGKINAAASIAYLIGPLLGGLMTDTNLSENLSTSTPFYFICILFIFLAGLSAAVLKTEVPGKKNTPRTFWERINLVKRLAQLFSNKWLQFLIISSTCFTLAVDIFFEFGPVFLTVKWFLMPAQLVLYNVVLCLSLIAGNGWLPAFIASRKISNKSAIIYSTGGFALLLVGMVLTESSEMMLGLFICSGFAIGLASTLFTVKISNSVQDSIQGEVMGVQTSLRVLGDAFICLTGGALLLLSPKIILIVATLLSIASTAYYVFRRQANSSTWLLPGNKA